MYINKYWVTSLLIIISCFYSKSTRAQEDGFEELNPITEEEQQRRFLLHRSLIYECMKEYMECSNFLDDNQRVSAESVERFKKLFFDNATVWNDYLWEPKVEYAKVYADNVFYYHRVRGLKAEYNEEDLESILDTPREAFNPKVDNTDTSYHTFRYEYDIRKGLYYILNKENRVLYYDEPIEFDLRFVFYVSSKEKWAKIMDILPVD